MKPLRLSLSLMCLTLLIACQSPPNVMLPATPSSLTFAVTPANSAWQVWVSALSNVVYSLVAHADRLWVGTSFGVWEIDLQTRHIVRFHEQMNAVSLLLFVENGQVWASDNLGLAFFDGQQWLRITLPEVITREPTRHIVTMAIDSAGDLRLETSGRWGSYNVIYQGHIPVKAEMQPVVITQDSVVKDLADCQKWSAMAIYAYQYYSSDECHAIQAANQAVPQSPYSSLRLRPDAEGGVWGLDLSTNTLVRWSSGVTTTLNLPPDTRVTALAPDPEHGMWIGTDRGLAFTDGTSWYDPSDLNQYSIVGYPIDLAIEPSGQVWLLTTESKLGWLQPAPSNTFKLIQGIGAHALATASDGVWITHGTDLIRLKLGDPIPASLYPPIPDCKLDRLTTDRVGDVWATTRCGFVWQYRPATGQWIRHVLNAAAPHNANSDAIQQIVAGTEGTLYAVGLSGLGQLTEAGSVITGTLEPGEAQLPYVTYRHRALLPASDPDSNATGLIPNREAAVDRQGGIWITATNSGDLWHYADGHATPLEHPFGGVWIARLHVDQDDRLWATSIDRRLAVYDGRNWRTYATPGIGTVNRIVDAPDGRIWFVGNAGIAVYDPKKDK